LDGKENAMRCISNVGSSQVTKKSIRKIMRIKCDINKEDIQAAPIMQ
jgi:hypothetical protein